MRVAFDIGEDVAKQTIDEPRRRRLARFRHLRQRDLELVEAIVACLVEPRRLAGRADEQAGEQIREGGVALPVEDDAFQEVRAAQERRVGGRRAAQHDVVAAACADVAAVQHELFRAEPAGAGVLVDAAGDRHRLVPAAAGMHVDLQHAGVGRHLDEVEPRVDRRRVALDMNRRRQRRRARLDVGDELEIGLEPRHRWHEHADDAVAGFDRERGAHGAVARGVRLVVRRLVAVAGTAPRFRRRGRGDGVDARHAGRRPAEVGQGVTRGERVGIVDERVVLGRHVR